MKRVFSFLMAMLMITIPTLGLSSCGGESEKLTATILPVKDGCKGIITIVHDDGDLPTARFMLEEFRTKNLRGNIAPVVDRIKPTDLEEWQTIIASGLFEIANHTYTHTFYGFTDEAEKGYYVTKNGQEVQYDFKAGNITRETVGAAEQLREWFPDQRVLTYIIPGFGNTSEFNGRTAVPLQILRENFISQRITGAGIDLNEDLKNLDYEYLYSLMVRYSDDYRTSWFGYVDDAIEKEGWGIFCFHNIWEVEQPTKGHNVAQSKASELFTYISEKVEAGELWCATMEEGTMYTMEANEAKVSLNATKEAITVTLKDNLDNSIYNEALTLDVDIYEDWTNVSVSINGNAVSFDMKVRDDGSKYIRFNMIPDSGDAVITKAE